LELYKFIKNDSIEWHKIDNDGMSDILIFIYIFNLEEFCKLIKSYDNDGEGLVIRLFDGYIAVWMRDLCDYYGIDVDKIFEKIE